MQIYKKGNVFGLMSQLFNINQYHFLFDCERVDFCIDFSSLKKIWLITKVNCEFIHFGSTIVFFILFYSIDFPLLQHRSIFIPVLFPKQT